MNERIELTNQEKNKTLGEKETQILGNIGSELHQTWRWKKKILKAYLRRTMKIRETKLDSRNLITRINAWAVLLVRYLGPSLMWTREEFNQMDHRTRKLMTMHEALHPRDDVDRLYVSRKDGGRGLASNGYSVDASMQHLEDYIKKFGRRLIIATRNNTNNTNETKITSKQKCQEKQLHGHFKRKQAKSHTRRYGPG